MKTSKCVLLIFKKQNLPLTTSSQPFPPSWLSWFISNILMIFHLTSFCFNFFFPSEDKNICSLSMFIKALQENTFGMHCAVTGSLRTSTKWKNGKKEAAILNLKLISDTVTSKLNNSLSSWQCTIRLPVSGWSFVISASLKFDFSFVSLVEFLQTFYIWMQWDHSCIMSVCEGFHSKTSV